MAQGNRYSSYRGRKSPGELLLAVLLILIIVAAVGFILLQRYMVYDEDGNIVKVIGKHSRKNSMSEALLERLKYGGASNELLEPFI